MAHLSKLKVRPKEAPITKIGDSNCVDRPLYSGKYIYISITGRALSNDSEVV